MDNARLCTKLGKPTIVTEVIMSLNKAALSATFAYDFHFWLIGKDSILPPNQLSLLRMMWFERKRLAKRVALVGGVALVD